MRSVPTTTRLSSRTGRTIRRGSRSPVLNFKLVCRQPQSVRLFITYRTPPGPDGQSVTVRIGSTDIGHAPASAGWMTVEFIVSAESLQPEINYIEIHWPTPDGNLVAQRGQVIEALENAEVIGTSATTLKQPSMGCSYWLTYGPCPA